ncbi:transporter substrate-binding domain-containing protein [Mycolicibacterium murale]|uniref:substrate-binding periplasmic protein n=1 Tax=Mycolicibacterium murale TaxID=182220 RepID=UPI0031D6ED6C
MFKLGECTGRRLVSVVAGAMVVLGLSGCGASSDSGEGGSDEVVQVAISPALMPYVGEENGELVGLDGELFAKAAQELGLEVQVSTVQFSALLAGVQSGRFDVGLGNVAWRPDRAEAGVFTDPPYYSPIVMAVAPGQSFTDVASLEGHTVGSLSGDVFGPALRSIPGTEVRAFPDINAALADVIAGRVDAAVLDPLTVSYFKEQRPDSDFTVQAMVVPTLEQVAANPALGGLRPFMTGWYSSQDSADLSEQLTEKIRGYYTDGTLNELVTKWGADPKTTLTPDPQFAAERTAVDRPEGWNPPSYQE